MLNFPTGKTTDGMSTSYSGEPPGYITDLATTRPCAAAHCKTPSRAQRVHSSATNRSPLEREPHPLLARKAEIARSRLWRVVAIAPQCHLIPNLEMMPPRCMRHSAFPFRSHPSDRSRNSAVIRKMPPPDVLQRITSCRHCLEGKCPRSRAPTAPRDQKRSTCRLRARAYRPPHCNGRRPRPSFTSQTVPPGNRSPSAASLSAGGSARRRGTSEQACRTIPAAPARAVPRRYRWRAAVPAGERFLRR